MLNDKVHLRWKQYWFLKVCEVAQSCLTLCNSMDCSLPGSSLHGILQARVLEWVAISFSNAWKWKVKGKSLSRVRFFVTPWTAAYQAPLSMGFSRQEYWSGVPLPSPSEKLGKWINTGCLWCKGPTHRRENLAQKGFLKEVSPFWDLKNQDLAWWRTLGKVSLAGEKRGR